MNIIINILINNLFWFAFITRNKIRTQIFIFFKHCISWVANITNNIFLNIIWNNMHNLIRSKFTNHYNPIRFRWRNPQSVGLRGARSRSGGLGSGRIWGRSGDAVLPFSQPVCRTGHSYARPAYAKARSIWFCGATLSAEDLRHA